MRGSKAKLDYANRLARLGYSARDIATIARLSPGEVLQLLRAGEESLSPILPQDVKHVCMELIENIQLRLGYMPDVLEVVEFIITQRIPEIARAWNERH